ncbi:MAG TPA: hypothetical protein VE988_07480 [Gemmataceae bacterium]|nr:hypothetical protein [Gemmataceae bacterium]
MATNAEIEMIWIKAWDELYEIVNDRREVPCQLPDSSVVSVEECKGWLQNSVYEGYLVSVETGWVGHKYGIIVKRWRESI